jgi:hypothetical protein
LKVIGAGEPEKAVHELAVHLRRASARRCRLIRDQHGRRRGRRVCPAVTSVKAEALAMAGLVEITQVVDFHDSFG